MRRALRKEFSWTKPRAVLWGLNGTVVWRDVGWGKECWVGRRLVRQESGQGWWWKARELA
jgi:hypothetical protein